MQKVFLEELPKWEDGAIAKGKINWEKSIGFKVSFIYDDIEGKVEIVDYKKKIQYLYIKYLDKDIFKIKTYHFQRSKLGRLLEKYTGKFKIEIGNLNDDKRDLIIINREYRKDKRGTERKWCQYKCNKCGYKGWIKEHNLLSGQGCSCCCNSPRIAVLGINTVWDTDRWMCDLGISEKDAKTYTRSSNEKISITCPLCRRKKDIVIANVYRYKSIGCVCGDSKSYPEKFMLNILEQLDIKFETEYSPDWISPKRYDFYFEFKNQKYIVEMDGSFHFKNNNMNGQSAKKSKVIDDYKDKIAEKNDIKVIRINCINSNLEDIKSEISIKLSKIFDFSIIDWDKVEEFALSNLVKKACDYKKNDHTLTTIDIGKIMGLGHTTILRYLKRGSQLGWCNYNPKEESFKGRSKSNNLTKKQIEIFKDNISLGIFESISELSRQSEKLFGKKLFNSNISPVCLGKRLHYKGFVFKYVNCNITI
jgi:aromatic ring-cleaving dioxygenase